MGAGLNHRERKTPISWGSITDLLPVSTLGLSWHVFKLNLKAELNVAPWQSGEDSVGIQSRREVGSRSVQRASKCPDSANTFTSSEVAVAECELRQY